MHTAAILCKITALTQKESNIEVLGPGDRAKVEMEPLKSLVVEPFRECMPLARFVIREAGKTIGGGYVSTVDN